MPSTVAIVAGEGPVVKRQKLSNGVPKHGTSTESRIFTPFRVCIPPYLYTIFLMT